MLHEPSGVMLMRHAFYQPTNTIMTERQLAENVVKCHGRTIVDEMHGVTIGGMTFGEKYAEKLFKGGGFSVEEVGKIEMACRHWVEALGYNDDGSFVYIMANAIRNC